MTSAEADNPVKSSWGKEQSEVFFEAASGKAAELRERNMCFVIADHNGEIIAQDKVKGSSSLFYKTAHGKVQALIHAGGNLSSLEAPHNILEFADMVLCKVPHTVLLGRDFTVAGCLPVEITNKSAAERFYVSASGSLNAEHDVECVEAGLEALGFAPEEDKVWRRKNTKGG